MNKRSLVAVGISVLLIACMVLTGHASGLFDYFDNGSNLQLVTITQEEYERLSKYQKLDEILRYIEAYYYEEPDEEAILEVAARGLLAGLDDPYTFYYNEEEWSQMWEDSVGEYGGIGIQMLGNYEDNTVFVTRVFKDTPAERAGLLRGDQLVRVEDIIVDATTMQNAVNLMRGEVTTAVEVEVLRGGEPLVFSIPRATIHVNRVEYMMLEDQVGYICLYEFQGDCAEAFEKALNDLLNQGAVSLILDLRDNGGGLVLDAVKIADHFLEKELMFYAEYRDGERENTFTEAGSVDIPLTILINEYSASSSEILAGALQDVGRATLVGTQSYGKGIMQYVVPIGDGEDGIQFTIAQYFMPSGKVVHKVGITPDIEVQIPEELLNTYLQTGDMRDPQLKAAWEAARKAVFGGQEAASR